jgi:hypothetical protein
LLQHNALHGCVLGFHRQNLPSFFNNKRSNMKRFAMLAPIIFAVILMGYNEPKNEKGQTVNPIIGDISFVKKFGEKPNKATDNTLRIKTHLEYVEGLLRQKNVSALPLAQQQNRAHLLDLLHDYWVAGIFPKNYDYPEERKPCFIDKDGNICAVGYLIEKTAGREAAEKINRQYQYEALLAMQDEAIDNWVSASGLTKEECAMIQPTYGGVYPQRESNYIEPGYGVTSSVLSGLNVSLGTINALQIGRGAKSKAVPIAGLITGAGQIVLGMSYTFPRPDVLNWDNHTNGSKQRLALFNIGVGTANIILSTWNLIVNKKPKEKRTSWNMYSFPAGGNQTGIAVGFIHKL